MSEVEELKAEIARLKEQQQEDEDDEPLAPHEDMDNVEIDGILATAHDPQAECLTNRAQYEENNNFVDQVSRAIFKEAKSAGQKITFDPRDD